MRTERAARALLSLWTTLTLAAAARTAAGQGNYRSAPLGGRSALMGGTGIAAGRDGAAPFLNPASVANVDDSGFAFSANFLQVRSLSAPEFHRPGSVEASEFGDLNLDRTSLTITEVDLVPSTLCLFLNLGGKTESNTPRHRLSFCFGTIERDVQSKLAIGYRGGSSDTQVDQGQSYLRRWSRFSIGPAYSLNVTEALAIGVSTSLLSADLDILSSGNTSIYSSNGRFLATAIDNVSSGTSLDLSAALGATYKIDRHYQVGIAVTAPSLHLLGRFSSLYQTQYSGSEDFASSRRGAGTFRASTPTKIGVGLAGHLSRLRFEVNATVNFPRIGATETVLSYDDFDTREGTKRIREGAFSTTTQAVVNSGVGVEWLVRPRLGILTGVSSDFTSTPPRSARLAPSEETSFAFPRMNRASLSVGVGSYSENAEVVVGIEGSHGWGRAYALNPFELPNRYVPIDQHSWGFMLILAGATNLSVLREAIENVESIVKKAPKR